MIIDALTNQEYPLLSLLEKKLTLNARSFTFTIYPLMRTRSVNEKEDLNPEDSKAIACSFTRTS